MNVFVFFFHSALLKNVLCLAVKSHEGQWVMNKVCKTFWKNNFSEIGYYWKQYAIIKRRYTIFYNESGRLSNEIEMKIAHEKVKKYHGRLLYRFKLHVWITMLYANEIKVVHIPPIPKPFHEASFMLSNFNGTQE